MRARGIIELFRPNVASLGYALFLAINAAGVWGGVFPFLPIDFQTHEILFAFFLAQSLVFTLSFLISAVGVYFLPGPTRRFLVRLTSAPYALGWVCLIAAIYIPSRALALVVCGGALLGLGSAGFYMLWQRLFASQDPESGNRDLAVGTVWAAVMYFSLYLIPQAVTAFLIPLVFLPLFGLCVTLRSRTINLDQPMFEDVPGEHPPRLSQDRARLLAQRPVRRHYRILHRHHARAGRRRHAGGLARQHLVDGVDDDRRHRASARMESAQYPT